MLSSKRKDKAALDRLTRLVKTIFNVDVAAISLIDGRTQKFQSIQGMALKEIALEDSFCRAPWREQAMVVIPDTTKDAEFHDHALVQDHAFKSYIGIPLVSASGKMFGTVCAIDRKQRNFTNDEISVLNDLAAIAANELDLREQVSIDQLTKTLTRRSFFAECERLLSLARRKKLSICAIMLDADHFKEINDHYGHAAGDEALRSIAKTCSSNLRQYDVIGRLGGEEFAVVLVADFNQAEALAERLRDAVGRLEFSFNDDQVRITVSLGVVAVSDNEQIHDALKRADRALYLAKANGRDCVVSNTTNDTALTHFG